MKENQCLKQINGICEGCPVLDQILRFVVIKVPYQEALDYCTPNCPTELRPGETILINPSGEVIEKRIDGIKI